MVRRLRCVKSYDEPQGVVLVPGEIVDQGMEVRFTHLGCFIEEEGRVIAQGSRDVRMFILDSTDGGYAMFAKGQKAESDIDLWHKRIGHVNYQRFKICNRNK